MIVSDNTLLCHFFLRSELEKLALQVRERDDDWIVPQLWRSEFANAVVKACWVCPDPLEFYQQAWDSACAVMEPCERPVDFREVVRLGSEYHISAYDAQYVHLALRFGIPLVTEDGKLQRKFPDVAVSMEIFIKTFRGDSVVRERSKTYRTSGRRG